MITVRKFEIEDTPAWQAHLKDSYNSTLYDDLIFLAYHPDGKFDLHHLLFYKDDELVAVMPAALADVNGKRYLKSPFGASAGGPVFRKAARFAEMRDVIVALNNYVSEQGWAGVIMRTAPAIYFEPQTDNLSFILFTNNYRLNKKWLSMIAVLPESFDKLLEKVPERKQRYFRQAIKHELKFEDCSVKDLDTFYDILLINRSKFNAVPTHTKRDLDYLLNHCGDRVKMFLTRHNDKAWAGAVTFELNNDVAYVFYLCHLEEGEALRASLFTFLKLEEYYINKGFRYFDMGPSSFDDMSINEGGVKFKEESGCTGFNRDEWIFETNN